MKIGYWEVQTDIREALLEKGYKPVSLNWHAVDWHRQFSKNICDAYIWHPHALHAQWFKLWDRSFFIESFLKRKCFLGSVTAYLFQNKQHQKYIFDYFRLPTPVTEILISKQQAEEFFSLASYPLLVKDIWGYGGYGISKISNKKEANEYLRKKKIPINKDRISEKHYIYTQELLEINEEFRIITVGSQVIMAYKKTSKHLLKHVWRGAEISFDVDPKIKEKVREWNKKLNLDWCGWDLAKDKHGRLFILELNPIFGIKVLESQGVNLADYLIDYLDEKMAL